MTFGMPTLIEIDELEDNCKLCKELSLSFLELNMNLPQYQLEGLENTDILLRLKEKYQIGFTIHLDENLNFSDFNKLVAGAYLETVRRTIKAARKLETPVINMHMNHGVHFTLPDKKVQLYEQYRDNYLESIHNFMQMCEQEIGTSDMLICIENTEGFKNYEQDAITILLQNNCFALTWDIGHSHYQGEADEAFILGHKDKLKHFHIHDARGKDNHLALGTGDIDLKNRLKLAIENQCSCVLETKTVKSLKESVEWLKKEGYSQL